MTEIRLATRRSRLAIAQTTRVASLIKDRLGSETTVTLVQVVTSGDRDRSAPIATLTELGAFVRAVQDAVLQGRADLAVHSLKDLPVGGPDDLVLAALPERATVNDVLVGARLGALEDGATVATGSPRRAAQLHLLRPDLRTVEIRGNVETRIRRLSQGEADAAVLAAAGLERLDMTAEIAETLGTDEMVPAPGQGALAVEARAGTFGAEVARGFDDPALRELLTAERSLLANTGAGCRSALGALAVREAGRIVMTTFVSDDRGPRRSRVTGDSADEVVSLAMAELGL